MRAMMRALLIDDNTTHNLVMRTYLASMHQIECTCTVTGEDGYAAALNHTFELILVDLRMVVRGWDIHATISNLKMNPLTKHIPVIAVVAAGQESRVIDAGADAMLQSPFEIEQLKQVLPRLAFA